MKTVPLHTLAHGRTGDKGNRSSISVIAYDPAHWPLLVEQLTEARVAQLFAFRQPSAVKRYLLPKLHAMNFVIDDVLPGPASITCRREGVPPVATQWTLI